MNVRHVLVAVLVVSCLASAAAAEAYRGDPLRLTGLSALVPFWHGGDDESVVEIVSPAGIILSPSPAHPIRLVFYSDTGVRQAMIEVELPLERLVRVRPPVIQATRGLIAIAGRPSAKLERLGFELGPLTTPIHVRVRWTNAALGFERIVDPISVDDRDCPEGGQCRGGTFTPFRSAGTFMRPPDPAADVTLYLVCPSANIIYALPRPAVTPNNFPLAVATDVEINGYADTPGVGFGMTTPCTSLTEISTAGFPEVIQAIPWTHLEFWGRAANCDIRVEDPSRLRVVCRLLRDTDHQTVTIR